MLAGLLLTRSLDERNPHVIAALRRLATTLPDLPVAHLKRAAVRVEGYRSDPAQVAILETIAEGWGCGRKVQIAYRSPRSGEVRQRVIAPYALEPTASGIPKEVRNINVIKDLGDGRTEITVTEYGYASEQARDLSKAGLEQCLDKMAALFS